MVTKATKVEIKIGVKGAKQAGTKVKSLGAEFTRMEKTIKNMRREVQGDMKKMLLSFDNLSGKLIALGTVTAGATLALSGLFYAPVSQAAAFEKAMSGVLAVTTGAAENFKRIKDEIFRLGRTTKFSAEQIAEGMTFLGMAGLDAVTALKALEPTINLARAANLSFAEAADLATNAMTAMRLPVEQLTQITDVFAKTAAASNTKVIQMAEAFKYAAPLAAAAGVKIELLAAAVGVLGDAGIQGSLAGTALRGVIIALLGPTEKAKRTMEGLGVQVAKFSDGSLDLITTLERLREANISSAQAVAIFNRRTASGALAMTATIEKLKELERGNILAAGAASRMATIMEDNLIGALQRLTTSFSIFLTVIGTPLLGPLKKAAEGMKGMVDSAVTIAEQFPTLSKYIVGLGGVLSSLALVLATVIGLNVALAASWSTLQRTVIVKYIVRLSKAFWLLALRVKGFLLLDILSKAFWASIVVGIKSATIAVQGFLLSLGPMTWTLIAIGAALTATAHALGFFSKSLRLTRAELTHESDQINQNLNAFKHMYKAVKISTAGSKDAKEAYAHLKRELIKVAEGEGDVAEAAQKAADSISVMAGSTLDAGEALERYSKIGLGKFIENSKKQFRLLEVEFAPALSRQKDAIEAHILAVNDLFSSLSRDPADFGVFLKFFNVANTYYSKTIANFAAIRATSVATEEQIKRLSLAFSSVLERFSKFKDIPLEDAVKEFLKLNPEILKSEVATKAFWKAVKDLTTAMKEADKQAKITFAREDSKKAAEDLKKALESAFTKAASAAKKFRKELNKVNDDILKFQLDLAKTEGEIDFETRKAEQGEYFDEKAYLDEQATKKAEEAKRGLEQATADLSQKNDEERYARGKRLLKIVQTYYEELVKREAELIKADPLDSYEHSLLFEKYKTVLRSIYDLRKTEAKKNLNDAKAAMVAMKADIKTLQDVINRVGGIRLFITPESLDAVYDTLKAIKESAKVALSGADFTKYTAPKVETIPETAVIAIEEFGEIDQVLVDFANAAAQAKGEIKEVGKEIAEVKREASEGIKIPVDKAKVKEATNEFTKVVKLESKAKKLVKISVNSSQVVDASEALEEFSESTKKIEGVNKELSAVAGHGKQIKSAFEILTGEIEKARVATAKFAADAKQVDAIIVAMKKARREGEAIPPIKIGTDPTDTSLADAIKQIQTAKEEGKSMPLISLGVAPQSSKDIDSISKQISDLKEAGAKEIFIKVTVDKDGNVEGFAESVAVLKDRLAAEEFEMRLSTDTAEKAIFKMNWNLEAAKNKAEEETEVIINTDKAVKSLQVLDSWIWKIRKGILSMPKFPSPKKDSESNGMRSGGILGGFGGGDRIPAWLEAGEGIIRKEAVQHYGSGFINALNTMKLRLSDIPAAISRNIGAITSSASIPFRARTGGVVPSFPDLGTVKIQVGQKAFPVLAKQNVVEELRTALLREQLLRTN